ncbi:MAG: hypothetical protein KDD55_04575, partial [Bdellovibrionales bacterium]|nr:hypothetical protein [Bdellovibrionales bacterium]
PELSMELYEKFLAYAIALDVDSEWAKRFSTFFTTALYDNGGGTLPSFYQGTDLSHFSTGFGTAFSAALQRALRTSRTRNLG